MGKISLNKIQEYLFYALVFLLPWQTRWIFKDSWMNGGVFEYGRMSLYGFDIVLIFLLLNYFIVKLTDHNKPKGVIKNWKLGLIFIFFYFYLLALIFFAQERTLAVYSVVRLLLGTGLFWVVQKIDFSKIRLAVTVVIAGFVQGMLAIWQTISQTIVANKWLGMASQKSSDVGTAVVGLGDERWLRAYGSWPHPNILGAFGLVAMIAWVYLLGKIKDNYQRRFILITGLFVVGGIFFSFSRAAWLGFLILYGLSWVQATRDKWQPTAKKILVSAGLLMIFLAACYWPLVVTRSSVWPESRLEIKSKLERMAGYDQAAEIIKHSAFGVGLGNYVFALKNFYKIENPWDIQPAHNTYVMMWAEAGAAGFILMIALIGCVVQLLMRGRRWFYLGMLGLVGFLMLFDHFWWTTASGVYAWWLILGLGHKEGRITQKMESKV